MSRYQPVCISTLGLMVFLLSLTLTTAYGQDSDPAAWLYSLKRVPAVTDPEFHLCADWLKIGERKSLVFLVALPSSSADENWYTRLYSVAVDDKGKPSAPKKMWTGVKQQLLEAVPVWLGGGGAPSAQEGRGLIFISYRFGTIGEKIKVAVAEFDSTGSVTSPFFELAQINAPAGEEVIECYLAAAKGEESVGLLYCPLFYKYTSDFYGVTGTAAYFLEVGFDGEPMNRPVGSPSAQLVRLNDGGKLQEFIPFKPHWTGKKWLMPVGIIRSVLVTESWGGQHSREVGSRLLVLGAEPKAGSVKLMLREIARVDNEGYFSFASACILPTSQSAGAPKADKSNLLLVYNYRRLIPEAQQDLEVYTIQYRLQPINDKGKKVGPITAVDFPKWNHNINTDPGGSLYTSTKNLSYPLQLDDGSLMVALNRATIWMTSSSTLTYENNFELYSIKPDDGELTVLANGDYTYPGVFYPIRVEMMHGRYCVMHFAFLITIGGLPDFPIYYTRF